MTIFALKYKDYFLHPFANFFTPFLFQFSNFDFYGNINFLVTFLNSFGKNQEFVPQVLKQVVNLSFIYLRLSHFDIFIVFETDIIVKSGSVSFNANKYCKFRIIHDINFPLGIVFLY